MSRLRLTSLAIAAAAAMALTTGSAHAATPLEIAVQDDGTLLRGNDGLRFQAWERIGQLQASYVRANLYWNDVVSQPNAKKAPKKPTYNLALYDRLVREARANGVRIQMTLSVSAPAWATSTRRVGKTNPNPKLFAAFTRDMARHFKGRVSRYAINNESNLVGWLNPVKTSAAQYREMYRQAYSAIKKADSRAKVFFGETAPFARSKAKGTDPITWLKQVLTGAKLKADGVTHHPYAYKTAPNKPYPGKNTVTMGSLGRLNSLLKSAAKSGSLRTPAGKVPGVYLSEHGYMVGNAASPLFRRQNALPEATRAAYWTQSLNIARSTPNIKQLLAYQLYPSPPTATWDTSILDGSGNPTAPFTAIQDWVTANARDIVRPGPKA